MPDEKLNFEDRFTKAVHDIAENAKQEYLDAFKFVHPWDLFSDQDWHDIYMEIDLYAYLETENDILGINVSFGDHKDERKFFPLRELMARASDIELPWALEQPELSKWLSWIESWTAAMEAEVKGCRDKVEKIRQMIKDKERKHVTP